MIRHWDVRRLPPPSLHGAAYLDRLEEVFRELAAEAYDDPGVLLPLTGGLDSRLFAAAAPQGRGVRTLTFGSPDDHDCALAARVAAARGLPHSVSPLDPAYVATYGPEAVWLLEGRLSPVGNITGSLMDRLRPATAFVSGAGAAAGRHFWRSRMLVPDWAWDHAADGEFERLFTSRVMQFGLPLSSIPGPPRRRRQSSGPPLSLRAGASSHPPAADTPWTGRTCTSCRRASASARPVS